MTLTRPPVALPVGSAFSIDTATSSWVAPMAGMSSSTAWGVASRAIYVPVRVPRTGVVRKLGYANSGTATGNYDIGLYDAAGVRLISRGSTAKVTTGALIVYDCTDTTIGPGLYYLALNNDTTTDTFICVSETAPFPAAVGVLTEAVGSVTLPATATWAVDNALTLVPAISMLMVTEVS